MNKSDKIYVAGHRGMVGSAIVRLLKNEGYHNLIYRSSDQLDLRSQNAVDSFFRNEKPDFVFLAAAKVGGIIANNTYRAEFLYDNLMMQANVINAACENGVKKLQFLGSSCIYPKLAPQPLKEEFLLTGELEHTNEPYAIAKIAGIKLCDSYRDQYGVRFHSVMPTNLYGPNDNYDLEKSHVLPAMIRKLHLAKLLEANDFFAIKQNIGIEKSDKEITSILSQFGITAGGNGEVSLTLWGTGTPKREFLHVDDLAKACLHLMMSNFSDSFLNIGTGVDLAIKDLANLIASEVGFTGKICWDNSKPDGTPRKLLDISKINELGWASTISLKEGIARVYQEYLANES